MRVIAVRQLVGSYGSVKPGEEFECEDTETAAILQARGLVAVVVDMGAASIEASAVQIAEEAVEAKGREPEEFGTIGTRKRK